MTTTKRASQRPRSCLENVSRLRPASPQPRCPARAFPTFLAVLYTAKDPCSAKIRLARLREAPAPFGAAAGGTLVVARPALPAICRKRDLPRASNRCSGYVWPPRERVGAPSNASPHYTSPTRGHVPNRRSSQVNTRARYSCANQKHAQQPLYLQSWPRKSSKCSSRSRSSARRRRSVNPRRKIRI